MGQRPNDPDGEPVDKVRQLQDKLWAAAKQSPTRRFHALYDRISRADVLEQAWKRVRDNRGAAGVDQQTLAEIEDYGVDRLLAELKADLDRGTYRPAPVLRRYIPKPDGGARPLGIPTVRDRIAQQAAKMLLEPIFEADFLPSSYGYRPRLSPTDALEKARTLFPQGYTQVLDADIADFFTRLDHEALMEQVERRISDRKVLKLVRQWLKAGVMEQGVVRPSGEGTPQGGVISPLLANIYLHTLDQLWQANGVGVLIRYADDCVTRTRREDRSRRSNQLKRCCTGDGGLALRSRPAGEGFKPPQAASVKSWGGERCGKGALTVRQVGARKANASEPPMSCRKRSDDIKTEGESLTRDKPGGNLLTAQAVSGMKAARAWHRLRCGTCEPVALPMGPKVWSQRGEPQAAETARSRVPGQGTGADRPVVAMKPANAGGAKGAGCSGLFAGQPLDEQGAYVAC